MHKSVKEFSVKTLEVGGLGAAVQALRLPFGKECRSTVSAEAYSTSFLVEHADFSAGYDFWTKCKGCINDKDIKLLQALIQRGDEHAKVLRGVVVWCEINAPRYLWAEFDTYKVGAERLSSESTMHIEGKGLSEDELIEMKEHIEESHMQKRVWMFSYQTLRRIYYQRKDHRLPQWRMFCDWIQKLPLAQELIICNGDDNSDK